MAQAASHDRSESFPARPASGPNVVGRRHQCVTLALLVGLAALLWPYQARAQNIPTYFPSGVSGYDQQLGVTVLSRLRPLYEMPGIPVDSFVISPTLDQSLVYNSDVTGVAGSGSFGERTSGNISANSDWDRNSLAGRIGFTNSRYFSEPVDTYTDWNIGLGGGLTIRDSLLEAAYSHQSYHQLGAAIATVTSETPVLDTIDTAHADYTFNFEPYSITPNVSASAYRYGNATVGGVSLNQQNLNRDVVAGGVTGRYARSDEGGVLVILRAVNSNYVAPQAGQPSNNSRSFQMLGGVDYQAEGVWRYRLMVGFEVRAFQASQYPTHTAPILEGSVIWTPTALTTLTGTLSRDIEDPESAGTSGYVLTQGHLVVDHEILENVFVQGRAGIQYAQFLQGGSPETSVSVGAGVSWLISPHLRLSLDYDFTKQNGNATAATATNLNATTLTGSSSVPFSQSVGILTLHIAL